MARYTGPSTKIARKFGEAIFGYDKYFERRNYPPGQHGPNRRRKAPSDYGIQLKAKQKAKYTYGVLERQFRNLFKEANRRPGITGEILLQLLEARLDNVVYRLGLAPTRRAARQLVVHKHIKLNGKICNIPSASTKINDVITVRERSKGMEAIKTAVARSAKKSPWLDFNDTELSGTVIGIPERDQIPENIEEQLIVELYSK